MCISCRKDCLLYCGRKSKFVFVSKCLHCRCGMQCNTNVICSATFVFPKKPIIQLLTSIFKSKAEVYFLSTEPCVRSAVGFIAGGDSVTFAGPCTNGFSGTDTAQLSTSAIEHQNSVMHELGYDSMLYHTIMSMPHAS